MRSARNTQHNLDQATTSDPLKCVWMLAGVVDYKLCDREYDCDHCAFDRALRVSAPSQIGRGSRSREVPLLNRWSAVRVKNHVMELMEVQGYELAGALFYQPGHIWARIEEGGRVRIGLDDIGQKLVGHIYSVKLPEPGTTVIRRSAAWSITHRAGETTLATPVTGTVQQINEKLALNPSLINHDPYRQGWAMVIQPEHLVENLEHLYYGQQAERWYDQEIEKLHRELRNLIDSSRPDVGVTLQDGGSPVEDLTCVINASQLRQIIDTFLSATTSHELDSTEERLMADGGERR